MPSRFVLQTILLMRDGKRVTPVIGKAFDFTAAEIKELDEINPRAYRMPVVEVNSELSQEELDAREKERNDRAVIEARRQIEADAKREREAADAQLKQQAEANALVEKEAVEKAAAEKAEADAKAAAAKTTSAPTKTTGRRAATSSDDL